MPERLVMFSVRIEPSVIRELDKLREQIHKNSVANPLHQTTRTPSRSDLIRRALHCGLHGLKILHPAQP